MKHLLFLLPLFFLISCSPDDVVEPQDELCNDMNLEEKFFNHVWVPDNPIWAILEFRKDENNKITLISDNKTEMPVTQNGECNAFTVESTLATYGEVSIVSMIGNELTLKFPTNTTKYTRVE